MSHAQTHFELFIRRKIGAPWTLALATEDRDAAIRTADDMLAEGRAAAVRVTKEVMNADTREFQSTAVMSKGAVDAKAPKVRRENQEPLCVSPADLYSMHARDRIGRLLDGWLERHRATPFELLHRPDLIEVLEASGMELQHAIQKIAVPESQERGISVHEMMRSYQALVDRAVERVLKDHRKGLFPDLGQEGFAPSALRLAAHPERSYLLGAGVAAAMAPARNWAEKVDRLLDLADSAPQPKGRDDAAGASVRSMAFHVLEQPLAEILGSKAGLADLLGHDLDLGGRLVAMTRLAAASAVAELTAVLPSVAKAIAPLQGPAQRLAKWLEKDPFMPVRVAIGRRILADLVGPRRLCPQDPAQEIEILRALAMALTAAAGNLMSLEDVQNAFIERSRMLMRSDFVEAYLGTDMTGQQEVEALVHLSENVTGVANKREAARWIRNVVSAHKFEREMIWMVKPVTTRLTALANMQRSMARVGLLAEDSAPILERIGEVGGLVEAESRLVAGVIRSTAPTQYRLTVLLRMASGETAPLGPAADRARVEVMKMLRQSEVRTDLAKSPDAAEQVRQFLQNPSPQNPSPQNPSPQNPSPQNPAPQNSAP
jgi:hypothetical protein